MNYQDVVSNVKVYVFEDAVKGAKYSYATDIEQVSSEVTKTTESLAGSPAGSPADLPASPADLPATAIADTTIN